MCASSSIRIPSPEQQSLIILNLIEIMNFTICRHLNVKKSRSR